jgi:hypothetical protein
MPVIAYQNDFCVKQNITEGLCCHGWRLEANVLTIGNSEIRMLTVALPVRLCKKQPISAWFMEVLGKKRLW